DDLQRRAADGLGQQRRPRRAGDAAADQRAPSQPKPPARPPHSDPVPGRFSQTLGDKPYQGLCDTTLNPLNPARLKSYRRAVTSSGAKDDPTDAQFLLEYLECHRDHLVAWKPDDARTRQLALVGEERRKAVDLRTQLGNRLRTCLKLYFPQALDLVGDDLHT